MAMIRLNAPLAKEDIQSLHAGDRVLLSGVIYTARDAAHARLCSALDAGEDLPVDLRGQTVFYAGPTPTPAGPSAPPPACAWMPSRPGCCAMA